MQAGVLAQNFSQLPYAISQAQALQVHHYHSNGYNALAAKFNGGKS
jgi:hypothetical protein